MINLLTALLAGGIFGIGLSISHMIDPNKVLGFLDITGNWDPSLALVMAGALAVAMPGFYWVRRQGKPLQDQRFHLTDKTTLDLALLGGSAIFGIGWGMTGYCPGPAVANLVLGNLEAVYMVTAIYLGFWSAGWLVRPQ